MPYLLELFQWNRTNTLCRGIWKNICMLFF